MATLKKNDYTVTTEVATLIVQLKAAGYQEVAKAEDTPSKEVAVLTPLSVFETEDEEETN